MSSNNEPEDKDSGGIINIILGIGAIIFVLFVIIGISDGIQSGLNSTASAFDKIPKWLWLIIVLPILGIIFHFQEKK